MTDLSPNRAADPIATTGTVVNPLGYAGQYTDAESGLQYLRARHYDTAAGQFLNRDPADALTRSAYAYAANSPLSSTDPTGLSTCGHPDSLLDVVGSVFDCASKGDVGGVYDSLKASQDEIQQHVVVGYAGCFVACGSMTMQGGVINLDVGGWGFLDKGPFIGWANLPVPRRSSSNSGLNGSWIFGAGGSLGYCGSSDTQLNPNDWEVDLFPGFGASIGGQKSILKADLNVPDIEVLP